MVRDQTKVHDRKANQEKETEKEAEKEKKDKVDTEIKFE